MHESGIQFHLLISACGRKLLTLHDYYASCYLYLEVANFGHLGNVYSALFFVGCNVKIVIVTIILHVHE